MDRELETKIDEISTAFERWAKEVADRIVEAAQQGAKTATQAREAVHKARAKEEEQRNRGNPDGESAAEDPWDDWAQMRSETWNRWAHGKFDKSGDADAFRRAYRQVSETFGDLPLEWIGREVFTQFERFMRAANERHAESPAARPEVQAVEVIGEFVDAEIEPVKTKPPVEISDYAQSLIKKIKKLDKKAKPKKLIKALMAELESDLKKLNRKKR